MRFASAPPPACCTPAWEEDSESSQEEGGPHLIFTHWSAPRGCKGFMQPTSEAELLENVDEALAQAHRDGKVKLYPFSELLQALHDTDENKGSPNSFQLPWCETDSFLTTPLDSSVGLLPFAVSLRNGFASNDKAKKPRSLFCKQGNQGTSGPLRLNLFENEDGHTGFVPRRRIEMMRREVLKIMPNPRHEPVAYTESALNAWLKKPKVEIFWATENESYQFEANFILVAVSAQSEDYDLLLKKIKEKEQLNEEQISLDEDPATLSDEESGEHEQAWIDIQFSLKNGDPVKTEAPPLKSGDPMEIEGTFRFPLEMSDLQNRQLFCKKLLQIEDARSGFKEALSDLGLTVTDGDLSAAEVELGDDSTTDEKNITNRCLAIVIKNLKWRESDQGVETMSDKGVPSAAELAFPEQITIAERLFEKTASILCPKVNADQQSVGEAGKALGEKYHDLMFVVLTPDFDTLESQTSHRISRAGLSDCGFVQKNGRPNDMEVRVKKLTDFTRDAKNLLVLIADECHHSALKNGAQDMILNHPDLMGRENVFRLLVSATPQNCFTKSSQVKKENVVLWDDSGHLYRGMDYFIKTSTWSLPACVVALEFEMCFSKDGPSKKYTVPAGVLRGPKDNPFGFPIHSYSGFLSHLVNCLNTASGGENFFFAKTHKSGGEAKNKTRKGAYFFYDDDRKPIRVKLEGGVTLKFLASAYKKEDGLLWWLGFDLEGEETVGLFDPTRVEKVSFPRLCDTNEGFDSVECLPRKQQRVIKDSAFHEMFRNHFERSFGKRTAKQRGTEEVRVSKSTKLFNGHFLMADYLLSLAYVAIYRVNRVDLWDFQADRRNIFFPLPIAKTEKLDSKQIGDLLRNEAKQLSQNEEKLKEFAQALGFAKELGFEENPDKLLGEYTVLKSEKASVQHVLKLFTDRMAWEAETELEEQNTALSDLIPEEKLRKCWEYIIQEKLVRNAEEYTEMQANTVETWFTETDRIVHDLLDVHPKYRTGRQCVMRVYESEENMTIQDGLRSAMDKLGLSHKNHGSLLSVVADIGGASIVRDAGARGKSGKVVAPTCLLRQLESWVKDPSRDLRHPREQEKGGVRITLMDRVNKAHMREQEVEASRAKLNKRSASNPRRTKKRAMYEDLENLPSIVILCEKGRMGDTFPQSMRYLDLRLRCSPTFSTYVQEFGRVCRYPTLQKDPEGCKTFVGSDFQKVLEDKDLKLKEWFSQAGTVVVQDSSEQIVCHASSASELRRFISSEQFTSSQTWKLCKYLHHLPTVLLCSDTFKQKVETPLHNKNVHGEGRPRVEDCLEGDVDHYARFPKRKKEGSKRKKEGNKRLIQVVNGTLINNLHSLDAYFDRLEITKAHYDCVIKKSDTQKKDEYRIALKAQCQQGKTGAYLHYAKLLRDAILISGPRDRFIFDCLQDLFTEYELGGIAFQDLHSERLPDIYEQDLRWARSTSWALQGEDICQRNKDGDCMETPLKTQICFLEVSNEPTFNTLAANLPSKFKRAVVVARECDVELFQERKSIELGYRECDVQFFQELKSSESRDIELAHSRRPTIRTKTIGSKFPLRCKTFDNTVLIVYVLEGISSVRPGGSDTCPLPEEKKESAQQETQINENQGAQGLDQAIEIERVRFPERLLVHKPKCNCKGCNFHPGKCCDEDANLTEFCKKCNAEQKCNVKKCTRERGLYPGNDKKGTKRPRTKCEDCYNENGLKRRRRSSDCEAKY